VLKGCIEKAEKHFGLPKMEIKNLLTFVSHARKGITKKEMANKVKMTQKCVLSTINRVFLVINPQAFMSFNFIALLMMRKKWRSLS